MDANIEYGAEYQHDGKRWGITYFAVDDDDARAKLESIKSGAEYLGKLVEKIPLDSSASAS